MTTYTELRRLAEAVNQVCKDVEDPQMVVTTAELLGLLNDLDNHRRAVREWDNKTNWVSRTIKVKELGIHRGDILKARIDALTAENEALRKNSDRYQWLRDISEPLHQFYLSTPIWLTGVKFSKENVDSTIDKAISRLSGPAT